MKSGNESGGSHAESYHLATSELAFSLRAAKLPFARRRSRCSGVISGGRLSDLPDPSKITIVSRDITLSTWWGADAPTSALNPTSQGAEPSEVEPVLGTPAPVSVTT